ncbi:hypothetical protein FB451DRAFT_1177249 [Mycena latifolia]|nr:hypothetical protein FB451DRAFT_1177249 [Mycena latifolia]
MSDSPSTAESGSDDSGDETRDKMQDILLNQTVYPRHGWPDWDFKSACVPPGVVDRLRHGIITSGKEVGRNTYLDSVRIFVPGNSPVVFTFLSGAEYHLAVGSYTVFLMEIILGPSTPGLDLRCAKVKAMVDLVAAVLKNKRNGISHPVLTDSVDISDPLLALPESFKLFFMGILSICLEGVIDASVDLAKISSTRVNSGDPHPVLNPPTTGTTEKQASEESGGWTETDTLFRVASFYLHYSAYKPLPQIGLHFIHLAFVAFRRPPFSLLIRKNRLIALPASTGMKFVCWDAFSSIIFDRDKFPGWKARRGTYMLRDTGERCTPSYPTSGPPAYLPSGAFGSEGQHPQAASGFGQPCPPAPVPSLAHYHPYGDPRHSSFSIAPSFIQLGPRPGPQNTPMPGQSAAYGPDTRFFPRYDSYPPLPRGPSAHEQPGLEQGGCAPPLYSDSGHNFMGTEILAFLTPALAYLCEPLIQYGCRTEANLRLMATWPRAALYSVILDLRLDGQQLTQFEMDALMQRFLGMV